jgi:acyl-CoA synthetase (NDP forming)/GNAT superfamily N-acetyltransferase
MLDSRYNVDVLLADGVVATIRTLRRDDAPAVRALFDRASDDSLYSRFFVLNREIVDRYVSSLFRDEERIDSALLAETANRVVGLASADAVGPGTCEVAFIVDEAARGRGIGTLLLEHVAAVQRHAGVARLVAEVLWGNRAMLSVFKDAGFQLARTSEAGVVTLEMDTASTSLAVATADARERAAEARSLRAVLAPRVVAVVGVSRSGRGVGWATLDNVTRGGFTGTVVAVHPEVTRIGNVAAYPTLAAVPHQIDLVVVAVPADQVLDVIRQAGDVSARAAVVITAGLGESGPAGAALQAQIVRAARRGGMRLIGPNCLGVLTNSPEPCNATFATVSPAPGGLAVASQSGGVGIALLDAADAAGLGVSYFVSLGNKADVSGNDLIAAWTDDPAVDIGALYLESFGNPLKFARLARHFSENKPMLAVIGGRSPGGRRAGASHTAAAAVPSTGVKALFQQAGVIAVTSIAELVNTARMLAGQPLPAGMRLAVCGNAGGIGVLAADAAYDDGLVIPELSEALQAELRAVAGAGAALNNPVDLGAAASKSVLGQTVSLLLASDELDSLLVVIAATRVADPGDLLSSVATCADASHGKPVAIVLLGMPDPPKVVGAAEIPVFGSADAAVGALAHAARYSAWRRAPRGTIVSQDDFDLEGARHLVTSVLAEQPDGCWLTADQAGRLLAAYSIESLPGRIARSIDEATEVAQDIGFPVVAKAAAPGIVHKTDQGLVATGLQDIHALRDAIEGFHDTLEDSTAPVLVQRQAPGGVELVVGGYRDPTFGPLVMVGAGGVETDILADRTFLLPPVTDVDVASALRSLRLWPLLVGYRGAAPADHAAVERILLATAALMQAVPEVAELDLNPVIVHPQGVSCVDVKLRLTPVEHLVDSAAAPSLRSVVEPAPDDATSDA